MTSPLDVSTPLLDGAVSGCDPEVRATTTPALATGGGAGFARTAEEEAGPAVGIAAGDIATAGTGCSEDGVARCAPAGEADRWAESNWCCRPADEPRVIAAEPAEQEAEGAAAGARL